MTGQVYKAHTDSYSVKCGNQLYKCVARGILKRRGNDIAVGDLVEFENGVIKAVHERKNRFIRPNVSNIDLIVAVVSPEPKPDFYLLDKLYVNAVKENVEFLIVVNKSDIDDTLYKNIVSEYSGLGIDILCVCAKSGLGIDALKNKLKDKLTVLAGQSAAGKTSIVNTSFGLELKTGEVSEKIARGRHTTTHSEIFEFGEIRLIDSPGFAVIDAMVELDELPRCYPEYVEVEHECKFRGCSHISEPQCKVKELVDNGTLSKSRYQRYMEIYEEISKRRIIYEKN